MSDCRHRGGGQPASGRVAVRSGSTLTEVLVALLIMSIGIVSLATLFPLATARSAKAVQMTTATDMRHNAEAFLDRFPESLARQRDNFLKPPAYADGPATPFVVDPVITDRSIFSDTEVNGKKYKDYFGVWTTQGAVGVPWPHLARLPAPDTLSRAAVAQSVDTYSTLETLRFNSAGGPVLTNATTLTLPTIVRSNLANYSTTSLLATLRIVFEAADGRSVQIRTPTALTSNALTWSQPIRTSPLPLVARIEAQEVRYSWMLAVRPIPNTDLFDVDVVTYFSRPTSISIPANTPPIPAYPEWLFQVWAYNRNEPVPSNNSYGLQAGQSQYRIQNGVGPNGTLKPVIRKGGFMVDVENNRWYRIAHVKPAPDPNETLVYLDTPVIESSKAMNNGVPTRNYVMFPRGVVDVFPLGVRK